MPSTYAHYRLGQQVRRELEGNERKSLKISTAVSDRTSRTGYFVLL